MPALGGAVIDTTVLTHPLRRLSTGMVLQPVHWRDAWLDDPQAGERWADNAAAPYGGRQSAWWRQNMEMELLRGGAPRWAMLIATVHICTIPRSEILGSAWCCYRSFDYGIRHPSCCAWFAVNRRGDRYFYRQYYRTDADVGTLAKEIHDLTPPEERGIATVGDPSIWRRQPSDLTLLADLFARAGMPMIRGDNSIQGYETVSAGFMAALARYALGTGDLDFLRRMLHAPQLQPGTVERLAQTPAIYFAPEVAQGTMSLFQQCVNLRYRPQRGDPEHRAEPVKVEDKDDEGPDVVRYAVHTPGLVWMANKPAVERRASRIERMFAEAAAAAESLPPGVLP